MSNGSQAVVFRKTGLMQGEADLAVSLPEAAVPTKRELEPYWQLAAFCAAVAIVISRQPDAIRHAQFLAEDGHVWFADAYNRGWLVSLGRTQNGYYVTLPRLAAGLALLAPLTGAPLVMNLVGLFIQALPAPLLLSRRFSEWGTVRFRAALALAYLVMPNCAEISVSVTQVQWHLALIACLLVLAGTPPNKLWRWFDAAVFILFGLTGPYCILLLPIACAMLYLRREPARWRPVFILAGASAVQLSALLFTDAAARGRSWPLGASLGQLSRIFAGQIYLGTLIGHNVLAFRLAPVTHAWITLAGTALFIWWLCTSGPEMRLFALFTLFVLAASLYSPGTGPPPAGWTAWQVLSAVGLGMRYWFLPTLACTWMLVSFLAGPRRTELTELVGFVLLFVMLFGFIRDWRHRAYGDPHLAYYAQQLKAARPGEVIVIPENPPGWSIRLVKK
jgi:hypothetical protein